MLPCPIDHLIITAPDLASGAAFVRQALGVAPQTGGEHPRMGTHNLLLRLGDALFLEVIAVDPSARPPDRPRWFGLDHVRPDAVPVLAGWVARASDIQATAAAATEALGTIEPMSRGALTWRITIPSDGEFVLNGAAPALIEWDAKVHPAMSLPDVGLSLIRLEIFHPQPERVSRLLESLGCDKGSLAVHPVAPDTSSCLIARIDTPQGVRTLQIGMPG